MHHSYSSQEKEVVENWIRQSIANLIDQDLDLIDPRSIQTEFVIDNEVNLNREVHEVTVNHRLSRYIEDRIPNIFSNYKVDMEYNRYINQRKKVLSLITGQNIEVRPDIMVHKRTRLHEELPHLLVVEAKKYSNNEKDRNHIDDILHDYNYQYKYGLLISYYEDLHNINCNLVTLENGIFVRKKFSIAR